MVIDPTETTITDEQASLLEDWLKANAKVTGWLDGYPLGGSYVDTRASRGAKRDGRQAYVDLDHATARAVPELRNRDAHDIRKYLAARADLAAASAPGPR